MVAFRIDYRSITSFSSLFWSKFGYHKFRYRVFRAFMCRSIWKQRRWTECYIRLENTTIKKKRQSPHLYYSARKCLSQLNLINYNGRSHIRLSWHAYHHRHCTRVWRSYSLSFVQSVCVINRCTYYVDFKARCVTYSSHYLSTICYSRQTTWGGSQQQL
jgi:hypothetical protein